MISNCMQLYTSQFHQVIPEGKRDKEKACICSDRDGVFNALRIRRTSNVSALKYPHITFMYWNVGNNFTQGKL